MSRVQVQYGITDVVVMVREVADHQDILRWAADSKHEKYFIYADAEKPSFLHEINCRSLGKTVLVRLLAKKHVRPQTSKK